nr:InlB B-repeat-containing protein [Bifidobacterium asteroides]
MATGTVFASVSDANEGEGSYPDQIDDGSLGHLQPSSLPSPSPLTTSSISPSTSQSPTGPSQSPRISPSSPSPPIESQPSTDSHTVVFDPADGTRSERVIVQDGALASPPADNPKRDGYRFDGWSERDTLMDFHTPITRDIILKARWTPVSNWALSPDHAPASGDISITITPPNADSLSFSTLAAYDNKLIGMTGDGRLFTWTPNAEMPVQVPSPSNASDDMRFIAGVVGDSYAALSQDHRIYTWNKSEDTPALLVSDSTTYASIAIAADHLIAVGQNGKVHVWTNMGESTGKAISLPRQALAVKVTGNADRLLALDNKGQVWTWKPAATDAKQIQPIKLANRIVQVSAMDHGFVLLDSTGQTSYLDNGQSQTESLFLPNHSAVTAISVNTTQAALVDSKGRIWAWKPGETPIRADDGSQQYMQAVKAGSRITAIDRQGNMFAWSLDEQGQPGKPARLDTTQVPSLETASMDGQPLKLTRNNDLWQTNIPAHKPGPAAITITGRQDGQPFTRSLKYTVDQPLTRDVEPRSTLTVHFDTGGGKPEPADQNFATPNGRVKRPSPDPAREGFLFDGWFIGQIAYDFSKPVDKNLTLTAKWTLKSRNSTWSISPDKGSQLGGESTTITPPDSARRGIRFSQVSASSFVSVTDFGFSLAVGSDGNAYAWGGNKKGELGDGTTSENARSTPVMVKQPDRKTYPDLPADFTYVQVSAGSQHSLAVGSDGNAYAWGRNDDGRLGDGTSTDQHTPVRVKKPAGTSTDFTYVQVSAGYHHSLALGSDGNAYAWGYNNSGQLGDGTSTDRATSVRVKKPAGTSTDFTYVQVSAGAFHSLALGSDGNAYAWGLNNFGQLGDGTSTDRATPVKVGTPAGTPTDFTYAQIGAGYLHSLAVGSDGYAYAWGYNFSGQLGNNSKGGFFSPNPNPVRVRNPASPNDADKGLKAVNVTAGFWHSLALGSDGNAYAWGFNSNGQLGNNSSKDSTVPVLVSDSASPTDTSKGLKAVLVSTGQYHSLALGSDGNAYAWGDNGYGQLGNNSIPTGSNNNEARSPVPVPVVFNLPPVITGVRFDTSPGTNLKSGDGGSVNVLTPAHQPGMVTVSVDYTLGGTPQTTDTSLRYTYLPAGVLPNAGGEGILLALSTGMTGMCGVLASRRHRREQHQLLYASHE